MEHLPSKKLPAVRWGIIGCGDVTEVKSGPAFRLIPHSSLIAVMRRDGEKAADYARRHGVPKWFDSAKTLIEHPEVDAVYIATPPSSHLEYALMVCEAGKPAYVEKPMALTYAECVRMNDAFASANLPLFVAYYRRGFDRFAKLRELVSKGAIGQVTSISYRYSAPSSLRIDSGSLPWRFNPAESGGGLFVDIGCHVLDLLDYLFAPLINCSGVVASTGLIPGVEDLVSLTFRTDDGAIGSAYWNFASYIEEDIFEVTGTGGRLRTAVMSDTPLEIESSDRNEKFVIPNPQHVQMPLIESVVEELRGVGKCPSTGVSAARTSRIIDNVLSEFRRQCRSVVQS